MKKKLLFMVINMNLGGTEKALLNMIAEIPREKFDITILMLEKYGELLKSIPWDVEVKYLKDYHNIKEIINTPLQSLSLQFLKDRKYSKALVSILLYAWTRLRKNKGLLYKYVLRKYPMFGEEYDIAVAYAGPMDFISYFVVEKIKSKKKVQWIHFDVEKIGFNSEFSSKIYKKFDKVFVVSKEGREILSRTIPEISNRINYFNNSISSDLVKKMSNQDIGFNDNFEGIRILTVGRLSIEKGQDITISVLGKLKEEGLKVKWYCIGEGKSRNIYEELIRKHNLEEDYILLGSKINPYPYMKQCDIYVQPSRHEGYCITLAEARCFNNPIVCTSFTGAKEQIKQNETGIIINFNKKELFDSLIKIINNTSFRNKLIKNLGNEVFEGKGDLEKLYQVVND
ncbi:glycosyltransferase [Rossellomorea aquimaris]|uniref:glycosyltransferase n=1 Tax=Rossellomorea aquimaris TaxID=189382 RepID=UPI001CD34B37|nr:glycosyltransferase [Rossellomorea aquimaris]MCA1061475.1 glycosyltransferase [Rossellomorea aquimaris]